MFMNENDIYMEVRRVLGNLRSIRAFARETDVELLQEMYEKLGAAIEERRADAEREAREREERERKRQELLAYIAAEGFSPEELLGIDSEGGRKGKRSQGPTLPPKYQFMEDGKIKTWNGRGRQPKPIAEALAAGRSLDEFLIVKTQGLPFSLNEA